VLVAALLVTTANLMAGKLQKLVIPREPPSLEHVVASRDRRPVGALNDWFPSAVRTGQSAFLKSFGRRRRTKVLEERTRGVRAPVYGDWGSWLMQGAAW
jgi:hypothetical protein